MITNKDKDDLLRKLRPLIGNTAKRLWLLLATSRSADNDRKNETVLKLLANRKARIDYQKQIRLPPPEKKKLKGDLKLGKVIYPDNEFADFGLKASEFIKHILITGMTGTGKTNLSFHILRSLAQRNIPFLVFDWKRNYQALSQLPEFANMRVIRLGEHNCDFRFNPLIPPKNTNPKHWMALLVDVIKHAFFVAHGVEYFFRKGINQLYLTHGIYSGKTEFPRFADLEKVMRKEFVRGREQLWMSSIKRVLASLTFSGLLGEILNVRAQPPIEDLLNTQVIIELDNLASIEKIFFVESLFLWIYQYRKNACKVREQLSHVIILEEAHHVLSGKKEAGEGQETIIETIIRMIREFGEGVIAIDQEPSKLSDSILANTNCKICFNLGNGKDIKTMVQAMSLSPDETNCIDRLEVGHGIVKMKQRFFDPIHVKFPLVPIDKSKQDPRNSDKTAKHVV